MTMRIIVFEGVDLAGKSLIKDIFNLKTNYKHIVLDRMFYSNYIYNKIYQRNLEDLDEIIKILRKINENLEYPIFFILVVVSKSQMILNKESRNTDENIEELLKHQSIFIKNFSKFLKLTKSQGIIFLNNRNGEKYLNNKILNLIKKYKFL